MHIEDENIMHIEDENIMHVKDEIFLGKAYTSTRDFAKRI